MTRAFFGILTIFTFLWIQVYNSAIMTMYELDKTEYIEHCENKSKPELDCNGKCHLSKQLIDQTESSDPGEPPLLIPEMALYPLQLEDLDFSLCFMAKRNYPIYNQGYELDPSSNIDPPPKFS